MNGYLRIKNTDLYERDGITYWRNGGNIIGNVVKAVIEENDVITSETYYIESLKTAKPIMLDPGVKIGGLTASESKNGNFIIVVTEPADFTEYGGGAGLKITFIYGVNYYSIETVESNGDIKIYDPDGESGTLIPDALPDVTDASVGDALVLDEDKKPTWAPPGAKLYHHHIVFKYHFTSGGTGNLGDGCYFLNIVNDRETAYTDYDDIKTYLTGKNNYPFSGWRVYYSNTSSEKFIKSIFLPQTIDAANNGIAGVNITFSSGVAPQTITVGNQAFGASDITSIYDYVS